MHVLSTLGGLLAGLVLGVFTAFFQLIGPAALALGAQHLMNYSLSLLNLAVYAILLFLVFFRALVGNDKATPTQLFDRSFARHLAHVCVANVRKLELSHRRPSLAFCPKPTSSTCAHPSSASSGH